MSPDWERAVRQGNLVEVERLLAAGGQVDARDRHGQTALMLAAVHGHAAIVERLVSDGADLNHTAKHGLSALMLAAINGHETIVGLLTGAGADTTLRGTGTSGFAGRTAADLARARGDEHVAALIEQATGRRQAGKERR